MTSLSRNKLIISPGLSCAHLLFSALQRRHVQYGADQSYCWWNAANKLQDLIHFKSIYIDKQKLIKGIPQGSYFTENLQANIYILIFFLVDKTTHQKELICQNRRLTKGRSARSKGWPCIPEFPHLQNSFVHMSLMCIGFSLLLNFGASTFDLSLTQQAEKVSQVCHSRPPFPQSEFYRSDVSTRPTCLRSHL